MTPTLSWTQRAALAVGSRTHWRGFRETGVAGNTQQSLANLGLAEVRWAKSKNLRGTAIYRRLVYRLTDAGSTEREQLRARGRLPETEGTRARPTRKAAA